VVKNIAEHIGPSEVSSVDEIAPGEGAIMRQGAFKIACYRSEDGTVTRTSAICTRIGCIIHWNTFEKYTYVTRAPQQSEIRHLL
jgi:nitrite reductase/ring-hydroxylating ferredoxin subunit